MFLNFSVETWGASTYALSAFIVFMIWAIFSASILFRFVVFLNSSISFAEIFKITWSFAIFIIFEYSASLCLGESILLSLAPRAFNLSESFSLIKTPPITIGPMTDPLPASSIPRIFTILHLINKFI